MLKTNGRLNWPMSQKLTIVAILMFGACIMPSCMGPLLSAGTAVISIDLDVSIASVTELSGYQLLVAGAWGPFVSALSRKYGKRPQFLFATTMGLIGSIICSASKDYKTLRAGRIVQGFTFSAYESLIFSAVGDLFFVHQRGMFTSIMSFTLAAVSNLTSVVCGPITNSLGWHYLVSTISPLPLIGVMLTTRV
jgi:MFS family permease